MYLKVFQLLAWRRSRLERGSPALVSKQAECETESTLATTLYEW